MNSGQSIYRCRMDIKNRRNLPDGLPFRNKAPGQFILIQAFAAVQIGHLVSWPLRGDFRRRKSPSGPPITGYLQSATLPFMLTLSFKDSVLSQPSAFWLQFAACRSYEAY